MYWCSNCFAKQLKEYGNRLFVYYLQVKANYTKRQHKNVQDRSPMRITERDHDIMGCALSPVIINRIAGHISLWWNSFDQLFNWRGFTKQLAQQSLWRLKSNQHMWEIIYITVNQKHFQYVEFITRFKLIK